MSIASTSRSDVLICWEKKPDPSLDQWNDWTVRVSEDCGVVQVQSVLIDPLTSRIVSSFTTSPPQFSIDVLLPASVQPGVCDVRLAAGTIGIADLCCERLGITVSAAHCSLTGVDAATTIVSADGTITIQDCLGIIDARSASGNITAYSHGTSVLRLKTGSGWVDFLAGQDAAGQVSIETVAGPIRLQFDERANADIEFVSRLGKARMSAEFLATGA
ncbi:MAG: hypothetical protein ACR2J8_12735, partial [Thermomicrobiales bacterium]